ncbi:MAG TPA: RidA family protein [Pirellulaceae bacterium]|nr:RidA family protein [Pirellulaceae bacterium]HMO92013.1 RidA family protein [Pirellulaceae bacterium]HMP68812.1 RidA family protein [Pirellulaceae bacterium]
MNGSRTEVFPDDIDGKLAQLGIVLPSVAPSLAIYKPVVVVGNLAFVSGHVPRNADGQILSGKLGEDAEVPAGQSAARQCAIGVLASLRAELGTLNRIKRVVKTTGMVNCTADFEQHPEVINGFSQLFVDIWGEENGRGARAAVGMVSLPRGAICEVDVIVELHE